MKTIEEIRKLHNLLIIRTSDDGGAGELWQAGKPFGSVIWSFGGGWDHVSVCPYKRSYTPSWDDMCNLKDMFFRDDEVVVQYHPAKSEYVNNMPNCLHLFRPLKEKLPVPPSIFVGLKPGQKMADARAAEQRVTDPERR